MTRRFEQLRRVVRPAHVLGLIIALVPAVSAVGSRTSEVDRDGSTRTFLIVKSDNGIHYGKFEEDCPKNFELTVEEEFLASLSPAERERLLKPENAKEYGNAWKNDFITGPGGENVCNNPKSFVNDPRRRIYNGVSSKVAYGLNLDGTPDGHATAKTRAHPKFEGLNGEPAVDNQLYRAIGCSKLARGTGPGTHQYLDPFLIELRGLDDLKNNDHVEMSLYSTGDGDVSLKAADGSDLAYQTFTITRNPRWRSTVKARIVNGVLESDPIPVMHLHWVMSTWGAFGQVSEHEFRDVRFRLTLEADGTLTGVMANYRPLDNIFTVGYCCKGTASTANNDCASEYNTMLAMADGYPDPATGTYTMISAAQMITGVPVFAVPPPGETLSAIRTRSK